MADPTPVRPDYKDGKDLSADDLTTEQQYHLALVRRHHITHHSPGIAWGLELQYEPDEGRVSLTPGVAVDGCARILVVAARRDVFSGRFPFGDADYNVWLYYRRDEVAADAEGDGGMPRWLEEPEVQAVAVGAQVAPGVVITAVDAPPDDPAVRAPVFVGRIRQPQIPGDAPDIDGSGRTYIGIIAGAVESPDGTLRVDLGRDDIAFAVYTQASSASEGAAPEETRRLAIDNTGSLISEGRLVAAKALTVGACLEWEAMTAADADFTADEWGMQVIDNGSDGRELRIRMGAGAGGARRTVIGFGAEGGQFTPLLTVTDDGSVTVHGDLFVNGAVNATGGITPGGVSSAANQFALGAAASGIGSAAMVNQIASADLPPPPPAAVAAVERLATQLAAYIKQDTEHAANFVKAVERAGGDVLNEVKRAFS